MKAKAYFFTLIANLAFGFLPLVELLAKNISALGLNYRTVQMCNMRALLAIRTNRGSALK